MSGSVRRVSLTLGTRHVLALMLERNVKGDVATARNVKVLLEACELFWARRTVRRIGEQLTELGIVDSLAWTDLFDPTELLGDVANLLVRERGKPLGKVEAERIELLTQLEEKLSALSEEQVYEVGEVQLTWLRSLFLDFDWGKMLVSSQSGSPREVEVVVPPYQLAMYASLVDAVEAALTAEPAGNGDD